MPRRAFGSPALPSDHFLRRGVYVAQWLGPNGEFILIAITSKHVKLREVVVPACANHVKAGEDLWAELDDVDPVPDLKVI